MLRVTSSDLVIDGTIKERARDFEVEEIPLYEANGDGQHIYLRITRANQTTPAIEGKLASIFELSREQIGYAGKKDKRALSTQRFSLDLPNAKPEEVGKKVEDYLDVEVESAKRHRNKLKLGHHLGNRFRVLVRDATGVDVARDICHQLEALGLPNYYGTQRFGNDGRNAERGRKILRGDSALYRGWKRQLFLNAFQSELFNLYLDKRIQRGWFGELKKGDIAKKRDTGGLFDVKDISRESPRFEADDITYTGPIYGSELWWAAHEPGTLEEDVLQQADFTLDELGDASLRGSRRRARIVVDDLKIMKSEEGLIFRFSLPKGGYATVLLGEFLKTSNLSPSVH
jgi:tRNA pseudouridine13 synthase